MFIIRQKLRNIFLDLISINRKPSNAIHILNGHFVSEVNTKKDQLIFEKFIINALKYFTFISLDDAIYKIENNIELKSPYLVLTFDDGFDECFYSIFNILKKYNISATFFINPYSISLNDKFLENNFIKNNLKINLKKKFLTWDMLNEMVQYDQIIGSHTYSHQILKNLTQTELEKEIVESKLIIESKLNIVCNYFAFPFGNDKFYDSISFNLANQTYRYTFTSERYLHYFDYKSKNTLSRRHFEPFWNFNHILYFTSKKRLNNK